MLESRMLAGPGLRALKPGEKKVKKDLAFFAGGSRNGVMRWERRRTGPEGNGPQHGRPRCFAPRLRLVRAPPLWAAGACAGCGGVLRRERMGGVGHAETTLQRLGTL